MMQWHFFRLLKDQDRGNSNGVHVIFSILHADYFANTVKNLFICINPPGL